MKIMKIIRTKVLSSAVALFANDKQADNNKKNLIAVDISFINALYTLRKSQSY